MIKKILVCILPLLLSCTSPIQGYVIPDPPVPSTEDPGTDPDPSDPNQPSIPPITERIIVGYATYWDETMPNPALLTHINYAFASISSDFETLYIHSESRLAKITALKRNNPGLKVLLSIGGWGAGNFSEMAADENHRKNFCKNCLTAVTTYNLDGIDLDWEYPTSSAAGISSSPNDTRNFTLLVKELRETLGEYRLLTMASSASAKYVDFKSTIPYFNFINLMTYDMGRPPYHNAGLYKSNYTQRSCDESVTLHLNAGVPYNKMVLGIPFYGHGDGTHFYDNQLNYNKISYSPGQYSQRWDSQACVPYLTDASGNMVLSYDDETSVGLKADYVIKKGLLGAMYWNIEADDASWTLSRAIASRLKKDYAGDEEEAVLVTNAYVQKFLEEVTYPERDYSVSYITNYPGGGPGEADIPPVITLKWNADGSSGALKLTLRDGDWIRDYSLPAGTTSQDVTNLVPNTRYTYVVTDSRQAIIAQGTLATKGLLHQIYFSNNVRNARDMGGRKTLDGRMVKYRMLYRGGRIDKRYMDEAGRREALAQGIKAELDLREAEDVPTSSPLGSDIAFCAPGFDGGYRGMLRDRAVGVKECFEFIVKCLREGKPVYFHCAAGRDRTGTLALILSGVLGVSESEMSKDFELTYFSPADWSMYQGTYQHKRTAEGSYKAAVEYIWKEGTGNDSFSQRTEKYLLRIGVSQQDINDFRTLMLE